MVAVVVVVMVATVAAAAAVRVMWTAVRVVCATERVASRCVDASGCRRRVRWLLPRRPRSRRCLPRACTLAAPPPLLPRQVAAPHRRDRDGPLCAPPRPSCSCLHPPHTRRASVGRRLLRSAAPQPPHPPLPPLPAPNWGRRSADDGGGCKGALPGRTRSAAARLTIQGGEGGGKVGGVAGGDPRTDNRGGRPPFPKATPHPHRAAVTAGGRESPRQPPKPARPSTTHQPTNAATHHRAVHTKRNHHHHHSTAAPPPPPTSPPV